MTTKINLQFCTKEEGQKLLQNADEYLNNLFPYERGLRMGSNKEEELDVFKSYVVEQVLEWTNEEKTKMLETYTEIEKDIQKYNMLLPEVITLIRTNGKEDVPGCRAYCRKNIIVYNDNALASDPASLYELLAHELFHIHSQNDLKKRSQYYEIAGFKTCNEIELPECLKNRRVTNPDAPLINIRIEVTYQENKVWAVPVLLYDENKEGGFFSKIYLKYMVVELDNNSNLWKSVNKDNPILFSVDECSNYYEQIGRNTNYNIHPEEIFASCFQTLHLVDKVYKNPELIDRFKEILKS